MNLGVSQSELKKEAAMQYVVCRHHHITVINLTLPEIDSSPIHPANMWSLSFICCHNSFTWWLDQDLQKQDGGARTAFVYRGRQNQQIRKFLLKLENKNKCSRKCI